MAAWTMISSQKAAEKSQAWDECLTAVASRDAGRPPFPPSCDSAPQDLGMDLAIGSAEGEVAQDTLDHIAGVEGQAEKSLMHR